MKPCTFKLRLTTGAFAAAAMPKDDVSFQLHGAYGISDIISFRSLLPAKSSDPFRPGATDTVEFQTRTDIGALKKLTLARTTAGNKEDSAGFFVAGAEIESMETKACEFFLINRWLKSPILQLDAQVAAAAHSQRTNCL